MPVFTQMLETADARLKMEQIFHICGKLMGRDIGWTVTPIMALVVYIVGLTT